MASKNYSIYIWAACIMVFFGSLILFRGHIIEYISQSKSFHISEDKRAAVSETISNRYNYSRNGLEYTFTFLEFGSTSCSACRQMQTVMETMRSKYQGIVNVVFINVAEADNQDLVDYYGIVTIPTQVLLDRTGNEYFRHSGTISAEELSVYFK